MIEQSLICKVLDAPDLEILHANGVIAEMFLTCRDEIDFIINHYTAYKQMPDKITFLGRFTDFQMLEVTESVDYLVYKLKEAYTYACCAVRSDWDLAKCIVRNNQQFKDSIGEIFTIVRLMSKYQIFKVHTEYKDVELDDIQTVCEEENYFTFDYIVSETDPYL